MSGIVGQVVNMAHPNYSTQPSTLLLCIALPTFYIIYLCFAAFCTHRKRVSNKIYGAPPGYPQNRFFLGLDVLWDLLRASHSQRYLETIQHAYQAYGNTFSRHILLSSLICTIEPANIKAVLSTRFKDYGITSVRKNAFRPFLGESILIADGAEWTHARAMLRPSFSKENHSDLEMFETHVKTLLKIIRREGPVVNLEDLFLGLTADITTHSMYGESVDSLNSGVLSGLMEAFQEAGYGCERRARWGTLAMFLPQWKSRESIRALQQYMERHVEKALQHRQPQGSASTEKTEERYVLLREMVHWTHDQSRLRDELLSILVAGRDTTASFLCSLFFTIAKRPDVWQQLRAEVEHLHGERPTFEQLKQMQYFRYCLNESESGSSLIGSDKPILVSWHSKRVREY